jgi:hypothetical protein
MAAALIELGRFVQIPESAVEALLIVRGGWLERADFRAQQAGTSAVTMTARYLTRYGRLSARRSMARRAREFPVYLQGMWELPHGQGVLREGVRRFSMRLRGKAPARGPQQAEDSTPTTSQ